MITKVIVGWRGVIAFGLFLIVFSVFIALGRYGDLLLRGVIWAAILTISVLLLARRLRRNRKTPRSERNRLLRRWHQWAMDECDEAERR